MSLFTFRPAPLITALLAPLPATAADAPAEPGAVVTVVRVHKPWYVPAFYLRGALARAVPDYERVPGLQYKIFTMSDDAHYFGGVYLWRDHAAADAWFSPAWHARVRERYGADGEVRFYNVASVLETRSPEERSRVVTDAPAVATVSLPLTQASVASQPGLLRRYTITDAAGVHGEIVLWADRDAAASTLPASNAVFAAPVLMPALAQRGVAP